MELELDSDTRIRPAAPEAKTAGTDCGLKLKTKLEEDKCRTLRVRGLTVKLPKAQAGEPARGTLAAKVKRVSDTLATVKPEPLAAKLRRVAVFMDRGGSSSKHEREKEKKRHRSPEPGKPERPPLRRRRH